MHCLYFVKVRKEEASNAHDTITKAQSILNENNFADREGYWGGGKCEWYVIGGRWSGIFPSLAFDGEFSHHVLTFLRTQDEYYKKQTYFSDADTKKYTSEIQKLWTRLGGKNANPYSRNRYELNGESDDATIITADLLTRLKKKVPKGAKYFDDELGERKLARLSKRDFGHWLVAVDYHF